MGKEQTAGIAGQASAPESTQQRGASRIGSELDAMRLMGKRNLDAIWAINRLTVDCAQRCAERQTEVWSKFAANALGTLDTFRTHGNVVPPTSQGTPAISDMIETILDHVRAVSETIARANQEALDVVSNRSEACLREVEEAARRNLVTLIEAGIQPPAAVSPEGATREKLPETAGKS